MITKMDLNKKKWSSVLVWILPETDTMPKNQVQADYGKVQKREMWCKEWKASYKAS